MQQGAEHVDGAALEAFAADQHLSPIGRLVGELPTAGGEVAQVQPPAAGVAARGTCRRPVTCGVGWGWQASNLRPSDYESLALTD